MQLFIPYHAPALFDRAESAARLRDGVVTAILCVATIEALLNDYIQWISVAVDHRQSCPNNSSERDLLGRKSPQFCATPLHQLSDLEIALYEKLLDAEKERRNVTTKLERADQCLGAGIFARGSGPLQAFRQLEGIRNSIVHAKGNTLKNGTAGVEGYGKEVEALIQSGTIRRPQSFKNWFELLETPEFCEFSIATTRNVVESFHLALPDSYMSKRFKQGTSL